MPLELYSLSEAADAMGIARQTLWEAVQLARSRDRWPTPRAGIPRPDAYTQSGRPLWKRSTLEKAGLIGGGSKQIEAGAS